MVRVSRAYSHTKAQQVRGLLRPQDTHKHRPKHGRRRRRRPTMRTSRRPCGVATYLRGAWSLRFVAHLPAHKEVRNEHVVSWYVPWYVVRAQDTSDDGAAKPQPAFSQQTDGCLTSAWAKHILAQSRSLAVARLQSLTPSPTHRAHVRSSHNPSSTHQSSTRVAARGALSCRRRQGCRSALSAH
jgi:hypothetical protein